MQLSEILNDVRPAAEALARRGLSLKKAYRAFCLSYVAVVIDQHGNNQAEAAKALDVSRQYVGQLVSGKAKLAETPRSLLPPKTPLQTIGEMEL